MVYRDLPMEEAQKRFSEVTATVPPATEEKQAPTTKTILKRKAVKPVARKST
jgi:hypothetical protein